MSILSEIPIHLGLGASATKQPRFTGDMSWYAAYSARTEGDGVEGRLVTSHCFDTSWDSWEMHPSGAEVVVCIAGAMTLIQEHMDGRVDYIAISAGDYAINPAGVWHTADVTETCSAIFITAGMGTQHRMR